MIRELTERLRSNGQVSSDDIDAALRAKAINGGSLALNLVLLGAIDEEMLADFYCEAGGLRRASAGELDRVGADVFALVPIEIIYDTGIVPLHLVSEDRLAVGVVDPSEPERIEEAEFFAGYAFEPRVISVTQMAELFERLAGHPWKAPLDELARALHARRHQGEKAAGPARRELFQLLSDIEPLLESRMSEFDFERSVTVQIEALDEADDAIDLPPASQREPSSTAAVRDAWVSQPVSHEPTDVVELSPAHRKSATSPPPVPVGAQSSRGSGARARGRGEADVHSAAHPTVDEGGVILSDSLLSIAAVESPRVPDVDRAPFRPDDVGTDVPDVATGELRCEKAASDHADRDVAEQVTPDSDIVEHDATPENAPADASAAAAATRRAATNQRPDAVHPTQQTIRLTGADAVKPASAGTRDGGSQVHVAASASRVSHDIGPPASMPRETAPPAPQTTAAHVATSERNSNTWSRVEPGASLRTTDVPLVPATRRPELQTPVELSESRFVPTRGGGDVSDFQGRFGPADGILERTGAPNEATHAAFRMAAHALATVESRDDIASELVESLGLAYPNVLVLSLRLPEIVIWGATVERGNDRLVGSRFHVQPDSVWERVVSESVAFHGRLAVRDPLRQMLGRDLGDETLVLPLTMKRRTVALLVLDSAARPALPAAAGRYADLSRAVHDAFRRVILSQKRSLRKA